MARKMIVGSTFYFVIGVLMGMGMSMTESFVLKSVHAHVNLLGWVSMAIGGIVYHLFPSAGESRLGKWHFWLHMIGIPLMTGGLTGLMLSANTLYTLPIGVGGVLVVVGTILFSINLLLHMRETSTPPAKRDTLDEK
ncbi:cytochrome-c oxidase [Paenibacillus eucommiae]|uniref:Cbb3-type cytochrome oxidase subunit 1 n=1 Tax=Paenibacillus eucommiae TaxID=1355755 RepID=A0ABS4J9M1_9BACL|nr:cytochrome-c oxidase [Paenibacillus eucommiae]MBP1995414.1 cbb3-type cytochrome oxidase subunit 1 [Paenibacillus eucommiae]